MISIKNSTVTPLLVNLAANYLDCHNVILARLVPKISSPSSSPPFSSSFSSLFTNNSPLSSSSSISFSSSSSLNTPGTGIDNKVKEEEIGRMSNVSGMPIRLASSSSKSIDVSSAAANVPVGLSNTTPLIGQSSTSDVSSSVVFSSSTTNNARQLISTTSNTFHHHLLNTSSTLHHQVSPENTSLDVNLSNQFLLNDFNDDFDVSLSNLCLGNKSGHNENTVVSESTASGQQPSNTNQCSNMTKSTRALTSLTAQTLPNHNSNNNNNNNNQDHNNNFNTIPLLNQFFSAGNSRGGGDGGSGGGGGGSTLAEMIKIEDDYNLSSHSHIHPHSHHHHNMNIDHSNLSNDNLHLQQQVEAQQHQISTSTSPSTSSTSAVSGSISDSQQVQQRPHQKHSAIIMARPSQSAPSPAMLMNHLDLSSIHSPPTSGTSSSTTPHTNLIHPTCGSTTTTTITHLRGSSSGFDPNEIYYDSNVDDSCQSLANVDSSTIVHNTKSLVLQSTMVVMPGNSLSCAPTAEEKIINQVSKRIRFKGLNIDTKHEESTVTEQAQQPTTPSTVTTVVHQPDNLSDHNSSSDQQLDLNAAILEQNPFSYPRHSAETLNENIYSSRNVANCYSYAWRRWSKTDAPSVKNRAGTVQVPHTMPRIEDEDGRKFQYILGAPTSAGTRVGLMTMTYLNQGQSYEIRLKKLKKNPTEPNLKTLVRLGFVEKRLQYRENEELSSWVIAHNNGRMIDIDFSMSYGVFDVDLGSAYNHSMTFVWNPGREASIFVKINCISTEFTSKRHGGERGTPFRLVVDTFSIDGTKLDTACCLIKVFKSKGAERKHKTDRDRVAKHPDSENYYQPSYDCTLFTTYKETEDDRQIQQQNQDEQRDELSAICSSDSPSASEIPQTSISPNTKYLDVHSSKMLIFSTTNINDNNNGTGIISNNLLPILSSATTNTTTKNIEHQLNPPQHCSSLQNFSIRRQPQHPLQQQINSELINLVTACSSSTTASATSFESCSASTTISSPPISSPLIAPASQLPQSTSQTKHELRIGSPTISCQFKTLDSSLSSSNTSTLSTSTSTQSLTLPFDAGAIETYEWLKRNRFFCLAEQLCDYTAEDLRRLSRDDLIHLCDFKDGIRLYNLIHMPEIATTKLTIFITLDGNEHYALYFKHLTVEEFREKLTESLKNNLDQIDGGGTGGGLVISGSSGIGGTGSNVTGGGYDGVIRLRNVHMTGPSGIRVKLTNNVIQNMKNESIYSCLVTKVDDEYDIVIRLINS